MDHKLKIEWNHYEPDPNKCGSTGAVASLNGEYFLGLDAKDLYEKGLNDVCLDAILLAALEKLGVKVDYSFYTTIGDKYTGENLKAEDIKHILTIEESHDEYDCDDCGTSWATGATVYLDDKLIVSKEAHAHCYSGSGDVDTDGIFLIALEKLGVEIEDEESDLQWSKDTCYEWECNAQEEIIYKKL